MSTESDSQDLGRVIDVGRAAIQQEYMIAERLDAKSRNLMTLAGSWFAVAQVVAGITLGAQDVRSGWLYAVAILAGLSGAFLASSLWQTSRVWSLKPEIDILPAALFEMEDRAKDPHSDLDVALVQHYASVLQTRRMNNEDRVFYLRRAERMWAFAVLFPLLEILVSLGGRLFG